MGGNADGAAEHKGTGPADGEGGDGDLDGGDEEGADSDVPRISDDDRRAIMSQVKHGKLTVDEAIEKILDVESKMKRAQQFKRALSKSDMFSKSELEYINAALESQQRLRHNTLSRPRVAHRKPNRE